MDNNIEAFKALIDRYETITLGEIQKIFASRRKIVIDGLSDVLDRHTKIKAKLTGFGFGATCTLCLSAFSLARSFEKHKPCEYCVFNSEYGCVDHPTYMEIRNATSSESLLQAYRNRAEYLKTLLPNP